MSDKKQISKVCRKTGKNYKLYWDEYLGWMVSSDNYDILDLDIDVEWPEVSEEDQQRIDQHYEYLWKLVKENIEKEEGGNQDV